MNVGVQRRKLCTINSFNGSPFPSFPWLDSIVARELIGVWGTVCGSKGTVCEGWDDWSVVLRVRMLMAFCMEEVLVCARLGGNVVACWEYGVLGVLGSGYS